MPPRPFGPMDVITCIAGATVGGWLYAIANGKGVPVTAALGSLLGLAYLSAPARSYPTGAEITEGVDLTGKVALVTGATSGIGVETARVLALRGAHVYLVARNANKLEMSKKQILESVPEANVSTLVCDLGDLQSVKHCAKNFATEQTNLHILINNAGIMALPERTPTKQGLEAQVGVCHVGHFYLTKLLMPALKRGKARIVCLSSSAHQMHNLPECLQDPKLETTPYNGWVAYGNAKSANLLFAKAIQNKYSASDNIEAFSIMPGGIHTGLQSTVDLRTKLNWLVVTPFFFKTIPQGAATTLLCATKTDRVIGGEYHDNCKANPDALAKVLEKAGADAPERCWDVTEKLIKDLGF